MLKKEFLNGSQKRSNSLIHSFETFITVYNKTGIPRISPQRPKGNQKAYGNENSRKLDNGLHSWFAVLSPVYPQHGLPHTSF